MSAFLATASLASSRARLCSGLLTATSSVSRIRDGGGSDVTRYQGPRNHKRLLPNMIRSLPAGRPQRLLRGTHWISAGVVVEAVVAGTVCEEGDGGSPSWDRRGRGRVDSRPRLNDPRGDRICYVAQLRCGPQTSKRDGGSGEPDCGGEPSRPCAANLSCRWSGGLMQVAGHVAEAEQRPVHD